MGYDPTTNDWAPDVADVAAFTGKVVRTAGGIFVAPLDEDTDTPIGPCYGTATLGALVLVVPTDDGPWIAATQP